MGGKRYPGVRAVSATSIQIAFSYQGEECRERIKLKPTAANLAAAYRHRMAILDAIAKGTFDYSVTFPSSKRAVKYLPPESLITIGDWLERWLDTQKVQVSASTLKDYRNSIFNQLIPAFGHIRLQELRRYHIKDWGTSREISNKRIANILSPLRIALNEAVEDEIIDNHPLQGWTFSRKNEPPKKRAHQIDPFTKDEQEAILEALPAAWRNQIQFAFWSGLRTSEMVALEWSDIDWKRNLIMVNRAETEAADSAEGTKTDAGTRDVIIQPPALAALKAQKEWSLLHPSGRVWLDIRENTPWHGDQAIRKQLWTPALKNAGVRYRNPYQTRHTFASMMLSAGESEYWVAQQMGHTTVDMIRRHYGRWIPNQGVEPGRKAVEMFWQ